MRPFFAGGGGGIKGSSSSHSWSPTGHPDALWLAMAAITIENISKSCWQGVCLDRKSPPRHELNR